MMHAKKKEIFDIAGRETKEESYSVFLLALGLIGDQLGAVFNAVFN